MTDSEIVIAAMDAVLLATGAEWVLMNEQGITIKLDDCRRTIPWSLDHSDPNEVSTST